LNPSTTSLRRVPPALAQKGFSLVEVVLAVGVIAFAFVAILGLIPAGLTQFRQAIDTSVCSQISQRVIMDAQQTEFNTLIDAADPQSQQAGVTFRAPKFTNPQLRYFDEQGNEVPVSDAAKSDSNTLTAAEKLLVIYHVNTRIRPMTALPGVSVNDARDVATVLVEVAFNQANRKLTFGANNRIDLSDPTKNTGVQVKVYSSQVGRNQ
jgi:uncharacterized protein (TIGR02598 family)